MGGAWPPAGKALDILELVVRADTRPERRAGDRPFAGRARSTRHDRARPRRLPRRPGATVRPSVLPPGIRLGDNDTRILSVARSLAAEGEDVVLVSKDLPLRVKAASIGLTAQEYRAELPADSGWTGMAELDLTTAEIDELYETGKLDLPAARELPCHTGLVLAGGTGS